ncbi:DotD/TraH family lipoprotein [Dyella ginsengisoli]|uniref:DotD/TraH family lipoprotein n=1 Tax=Dyella ginsengisoli TaxID=363848 RepID=UPI00034534AD|nr:DotD/TraH family lipoprotein [Dyella ginsengisoli]
MPFHHKAAADFDQALLDKQLLDAAHRIELTQAELRQVNGVSTTDTLADQLNLASQKANSQPVTIDWSGDASELVKLLAMRDGLSFEKRGVAVPLPVAVNAKRLPYGEVMAMLRAQLGYRATVYGLPGKLVIEYSPSTGVLH